jgi:hypothetical protein
MLAQLSLIARLLGRFLSGRHMDGQARSDSTFLSRGSDAPAGYWGSGRPSRWAMLAGWHRVAVRLVLVAVLAGWLNWRHGTEWALVLVGGPVLGLAVHRGRRAVTGWRHERQLRRPMAAALAPYLGVPPAVVEDSLSIVRGYEDTGSGEHVGSLGLPDDWAGSPEQRTAVERVVSDRTGLDLKWQWRMSGYPLLLNFTRAPVPPTNVPLAEVLAELAAAPEHLVLLGRAPDGTMHVWDRSAEDPHIAIHGGSRRGKTSLLLSLAGQDLARGGDVTGIDPKRVSLMALAGLPGVTLLNDPRDVPAMWAGVAAFRAEVEDRFDQLADDPTLEFRRKLLLIDEVSMFAGMSAQLWRLEKASSDPALPPVWDDVAACVWLGAQVHAHVVVAGQRLDYKILGGMLGSFGVRMLAGYAPQDYARLVGLTPFMRSQKPRGRFLLYEGGELTWLQLIFGEPSQWRDYVRAAAGRGPELARERPTGTGDGSVLVVGLAAAAAHLGMREDAFRKARQRRPIVGETSDGGRPVWTEADLDAWRERRPSVSR